MVSLGGGDHGVGNAGVAAGGVDERTAGLEFSGALTVANHIERRAVFDGATGVETLALGVDFDVGEVAADVRQANQRRVADLIEHRVGAVDFFVRVHSVASHLKTRCHCRQLRRGRPGAGIEKKALGAFLRVLRGSSESPLCQSTIGRFIPI